MKRTTAKPVLGLTMGDPAGIGPEICLRALRDKAVLQRCTPVLFGDASVLRRVARNGDRAARIVSPEELEEMLVVGEPLIVDCAAIDGEKVEPGRISAACGRAGYVYIERAIAAALRGKFRPPRMDPHRGHERGNRSAGLLTRRVSKWEPNEPGQETGAPLHGKIAGVVTAPIHKESLNQSGVKHPGHTEIFAALTGAKRSCMMLYSDKITVSMVTTHIGYHEVPGKLSIERVLNVIELTAETMRRILRREPRVGVCGLNPHAGEHGLFGRREEENFVEPAVLQARARGIRVEGPLVPDAAFTLNVRKKFDAIVTLYHDQGHIPFKMLAFDTGVNITLGLPIIRTSVDHGTAFDIAWQGKADPTSLFSAIGVAADLAQEQSDNPGATLAARANGQHHVRKTKVSNRK